MLLQLYLKNAATVTVVGEGCLTDVYDVPPEKYGLEDGDIVIARSGASCGQSYVYQQKHGDMVYASYLIRFRLNKDLVDKEYIRAYLSSPPYWEQVDSAKKGAAQNNINAGSIKDFKMPIPH